LKHTERSEGDTYMSKHWFPAGSHAWRQYQQRHMGSSHPE